MSAGPLWPSASSCCATACGQGRSGVVPVRLGGVEPGGRAGVGAVHVHARPIPAHDHEGRVVQVEPLELETASGADDRCRRRRLRSVAMDADCPAMLMPDMAVELDSSAAAG